MRFLAMFFCLTLLGCASMRPPLGDDSQVPHFADHALVTRDGMRLPLREWDAGGAKPKAVIIGLHGMSDYSNAFDGPAKEWAKFGITTLAIDQRGFGRAPNPGLWAGSEVMRHDLDDFAVAAHARFPGVKIFAAGESMGGAVLLTALASPTPPQIDGAILVSPAVWSRADMPVLYRVALFLVAHLTPGIVLSNSSASHFVTVVASDNIPMLIALAHDPLFQKTTRVDTLAGLVNLMDQARRAAGEIKHAPPILFLHGDRDQIIPPKSAAAAIAALDGHTEVREYPDGYHMLLRDLEGRKVQDDVAHWVLVKCGNSPEIFAGSSRYQPADIPESKMDEKKKHDLREEGGPPTSVTNTQSRMAGGADNPNVNPDENPPLATPGGPDQRIPEGQTTKGD